MLASSGELPIDSKDYTFEYKWDGVRAICICNPAAPAGQRFKPEKYHDEYREKVIELIEHKAHGQHVVTRPSEDTKAARKVGDLMAALEASLAKTRGDAKPAARTHARRRKSA